MRHVSLAEFGQSVGCQGNRLIVKQEGSIVLEAPLSRLRTISIARNGVSISSNLLVSCAQRGIRLHVLDWRNIAVASLVGRNQHAVATLRQRQFEFLGENQARSVAAEFIVTKIRNQRATLLYFSKYLRQAAPERAAHLISASHLLAQTAREIKLKDWANYEQWREQIMGYEGAAAARYFSALSTACIFADTFTTREGRGSSEIVNQMLNFGYTILMSYVWNALDNAGFELYAGFLHQERPGRASLVLDLMEEYRPWVVDRTVANLKGSIKNDESLTPRLKKKLTGEIHKCLATHYPFRGKRLRLESIIQRQAYQLAGVIMTNKKHYRGYRFRW